MVLIWVSIGIFAVIITAVCLFLHYWRKARLTNLENFAESLRGEGGTGGTIYVDEDAAKEYVVEDAATEVSVSLDPD